MLISVIATGAFVVKVGPHTQLKEYTREFYQQYEHCFKKTVNRKLRELIYEVIEDAENLTPEEQDVTRYFMANIHDAFCWGGYFSSTGVMLAIPANFAYETVSEINLKNYNFGPLTADKENNQKNYLSHEMLASEDAKVHYA